MHAKLTTYCYGVFVLGLAATAAFAQTAPDDSPKDRKSSLGFRVRAFPLGAMGIMGDAGAMTTTIGSPTYDWQFRTTSRGFPLGVGPAFEFMLGKRFTLSAEVMFQRLRYDKVTNVFSGTDDPNTGTDERSRITRTERTKARLFEAPVLLHYRIASQGRLSRLFVAGGAAVRTVSKVRTTNDVAYANGDTASDANAAAVSNRNVLGAVVGVGFRFIDDFHIKSTPEIRFTRWRGRAFDLDTTRSPVNQLEIGIGFTF